MPIVEFMKEKYLLVALFVIVGIVGFAGSEYFPETENEIIPEALDSVEIYAEASLINEKF